MTGARAEPGETNRYTATDRFARLEEAALAHENDRLCARRLKMGDVRAVQEQLRLCLCRADAQARQVAGANGERGDAGNLESAEIGGGRHGGETRKQSGAAKQNGCGPTMELLWRFAAHCLKDAPLQPLEKPQPATSTTSQPKRRFADLPRGAAAPRP
jgi:hypothetical protein